MNQKKFILELTVLQRSKILEILPRVGTREQGIVQRDIDKKVKITQDDIARIEMKSDDQGTRWRADLDAAQPIDFTEMEIRRLKAIIEGIEKENRLPLEPQFLEFLDQLDEVKLTPEPAKK